MPEYVSTAALQKPTAPDDWRKNAVIEVHKMLRNASISSFQTDHLADDIVARVQTLMASHVKEFMLKGCT